MNNNFDKKGLVAKYQRIPYYPFAFKSGSEAIDNAIKVAKAYT